MRILYSHRIQSHDGMGVHIEALVAAMAVPSVSFMPAAPRGGVLREWTGLLVQGTGFQRAHPL